MAEDKSQKTKKTRKVVKVNKGIVCTGGDVNITGVIGDNTTYVQR